MTIFRLVRRRYILFETLHTFGYLQYRESIISSQLSTPRQMRSCDMPPASCFLLHSKRRFRLVMSYPAPIYSIIPISPEVMSLLA